MEEIFLILIMLAAVAVAVFAGNELAAKSCQKTYAESGMAVKYSFWTDCMVEVNGRWIPADNWRAVDNGH